MKKLLTMLLVGIMSSVLLVTPAAAYSSSEMPNALLLYVGTNSNHFWDPYPAFSNNDLDKILDAIQEFVIINSNATYNYYQKNGTTTQIVSNSSINAIQSSDIQFPNTLANIKEDYLGLLSSAGSYPSVTLDKSVSAQVELAKQIISREPNATIWFSFPTVTFQACAQHYKEPFTYMFNQIKSQIGTTAWNKNVRGFYWGTEAVTSYYTKFDEGAPGNYYNNRMIQLMADIGNLVHNNNKQFMWIPYNTKDTETSSLYTFIRAGYVANKTNIFDYVTIQPGYYQNSDMSNQLNYVKKSAQDNKFYNNSGGVVGGTKTSSTKIGAEMEIDSKIAGGSNWQGYNDRYYEYTVRFKPLRGSTPFTFYAGDRDSLMNSTVLYYVTDFLNY